MSGRRRTWRSARRPKRRAPTGRKASVRVIESAMAASEVWNSCAIAVRAKTTRKKSNASSVQPRKEARIAARCPPAAWGLAAPALGPFRAARRPRRRLNTRSLAEVEGERFADSRHCSGGRSPDRLLQPGLAHLSDTRDHRVGRLHSPELDAKPEWPDLWRLGGQRDDHH